MQEARRQEHNSAHVDNRKAAMADRVAALRLIHWRGRPLGFAFVLRVGRHR